MNAKNVRAVLPSLKFGRGRQAPKVSWWMPYWFHVPRTLRTWRILFESRSLVRVVILSALIGAAIVIGIKIAVPGVQLPRVWIMLLTIPAPYVYMLVMLLAHTLLPSHVIVRKDRVHVATGQSHWLVKSDVVKKTRIVVFAVDRIRLRVFYLHKETLRSRTIGVSRRVNLDSLCEALIVPPQIWDAQSRYKRPQAT